MHKVRFFVPVHSIKQLKRCTEHYLIHQELVEDRRLAGVVQPDDADFVLCNEEDFQHKFSAHTLILSEYVGKRFSCSLIFIDDQALAPYMFPRQPYRAPISQNQILRVIPYLRVAFQLDTVRV